MTSPNYRTVVLKPEISLRETYQLMNDTGLMIALKNHSYQIPYGVVKLEGKLVVDLEGKPSHTSFVTAGMHVVDPDVLSLIPAETPFDMPI